MQSERIRRLEDDVVVKLFGDKAVLADPDQAFDKFISSSPSAQKLGVGILGAREGGPELLAYMRRRYLDSVLDDATGGAVAANQSTLNPKSLFEGLTDARIQKSPLFTSEQKKWMASAGADIRVILNSLPDPARVGTDLTPADLTANVIGMNPVFVSRLVARVVTGVGLENVLFTQQGRTALNTIRNLENASDASRNAAMAYLIGLVAREKQEGSESEAEASPNPLQ
jgi:hypothetical protein